MWYCSVMRLWKVASWGYIVFPVVQNVHWCHYQSRSYPSWRLMLADFLYVIWTVLYSFLSQEALIRETHFCTWLNADPCTSRSEPLEKMVLFIVVFCIVGQQMFTIECSSTLLEVCISLFGDLNTAKFAYALLSALQIWVNKMLQFLYSCAAWRKYQSLDWSFSSR